MEQSLGLNKNSKVVIKQLFKAFNGLLNKNSIVNGTVEVIGKSIRLDPKDSKLSYYDLRPFPLGYAQQEEDWYNSQDLCIKRHPGIENNKTWMSCATDAGFVNSNYGYMCYNLRGLKKSQFDYAVDNLVNLSKGNSGRQSVIYYAGPEMQEIHNDGIHANHDFTCTFTTQHFIRGDKLLYIVNQRSCDAIFGLTFDFYHHCHVYEKMIEALKDRGIFVKPGYIQFNFGSIHVYERHFKLIQEIVKKYNQVVGGKDEADI